MIVLQNVSKSFYHKNKELNVLDNLNLTIKDGELVTIFGPNGCGKTTLLYIIAGILNLEKGKIEINRQDAYTKKLDLKIGFIFQDYTNSLLPWRTVEDNIKLGLEFDNRNNTSTVKTVNIILKKLGLSEFRKKYPYQLSGGMKQLVCIGRALAYAPDLFILDEPFSSLDYSIRKDIELEFLKIWEESRKTTIFVSHEVDEAVLLADRVVILSKRPTKIKKIIDVKLPRPRTLNMLRSKEFYRIRNKVLKIFGN